MIARKKKGGSFSNAANYDLDKDGRLKKDTTLLYVSPRIDFGGNLNNPDLNKISKSFEIQASLNPFVKKPVYHLVLSFHPDDGANLSDETMVQIAIHYLVMMGFTDTQITITRHREKDNPHMHIILNMVNNRGKRLSDYRDYDRSQEACKNISLLRGFRWGLHKTLSHVAYFRDPREEVRYGIAKALMKALNDERVKDMEDLAHALIANGIFTKITYGAQHKPIGVKFSKRAKARKKKNKMYIFSGRQIDRCFTCPRILDYMSNDIDFGILRTEAQYLDDLIQMAHEGLLLDESVQKGCIKLHQVLFEIEASERCMSNDSSVDAKTANSILKMMYQMPLNKIVQRVEPAIFESLGIDLNEALDNEKNIKQKSL